MVFFSEKLKAALRDLYSDLTIPFQQTVDDYSDTEAALDDMFVQLLLQEYSMTHLPETPGYRDVKELQELMQKSTPIKLSQLFDRLQDKLAPRSVLLLGRAGVGKSTLMKQVASMWAKGELWKDIEYLFLITLRQLQQDRKWTLADLLLDGLPLDPAEKQMAVDLLRKQSSRVLCVQEGMDEIDIRHLKGRDLQRDCHKDTDLGTILSSITCNVMLKGAKVIVTSRPNNNVPECNRKTELYGFSDESIQMYIHKFSGGNNDLETFIKDYLRDNVNIATHCYLPIQANFVCAYLSDMFSATHCENTTSIPREDISAVRTMTQLYVLAAINMAKKHGKKHKSLEHEGTFDDMLSKSVRCHAKLAKHCTMSTPLQIIMYDEDLEEFGISEENRQTGFLAESETKRLKGRLTHRRHRCWTFHHLSMQEMFAAVGLLLGPREELMKVIQNKESARQHEVLIKFIVGLWCDPPNRDFMDLVSGQAEAQETTRSGKLTCQF